MLFVEVTQATKQVQRKSTECDEHLGVRNHVHDEEKNDYIYKVHVSSPYAGGVYKGKLVFPSEFPFKPPAIYMSTPNGRFKTDMRLCLSISGT